MNKQIEIIVPKLSSACFGLTTLNTLLYHDALCRLWFILHLPYFSFYNEIPVMGFFGVVLYTATKSSINKSDENNMRKKA